MLLDITVAHSHRVSVGLAFCGFMLIGALGGSSGILLPSQMTYYHVDKTVIGLLFVAFSLGYFLSAFSAGLFAQKLGVRLYLMSGVALFLLSALAMSLRPPFIFLLVINFFLAFGGAVVDAGMNTYVASLPRSTILLNYLHAFYGAGALLGPIIASAFLIMNWSWNAVYLVWAAISLSLLLGLGFFFRDSLPSSSSQGTEALAHGNMLLAALKLLSTWLAALFLFLYIGIEVSVGNWSYSFLLEDRHQNALLAGWGVSSFWLGLTLGRFLVRNIAKRLYMNVEAMVFCCLVGIMGEALLVWLMPDGVAPAIGFCLIGCFLAVLYPTTIALIPKLVPARLVPSSIGFLVGSSVVGGAIFPWLAGVLAQFIGIWSLLPYIVVLAALMVGNWWLVVRRL